MDYRLEDLLPIVARLTNKYTMKESTSVSYETAQMLMNAVTYCMDEYFNNLEYGLMDVNNGILADAAYDRGYSYVIEKVFKAKEIYEKVIRDFEDYGCKNYSETIINGMPAFFVNYDAKFKPQDHILTLDYPTINIKQELCGVDIIFAYLSNILIESEFLYNFDTYSVQSLLDRIQPDYKELFMDNIAYPVLLNAIGCAIVDKPIRLLELDDNDFELIECYFKGDVQDKMEEKISAFISFIVSGITGDKDIMKPYFMCLSHEYAIRIFHAIQNNNIKVIFGGIEKKYKV